MPRNPAGKWVELAKVNRLGWVGPDLEIKQLKWPEPGQK